MSRREIRTLASRPLALAEGGLVPIPLRSQECIESLGYDPLGRAMLIPRSEVGSMTVRTPPSNAVHSECPTRLNLEIMNSLNEVLGTFMFRTFCSTLPLDVPDVAETNR